jgi:hypothetical protein
VLDWVSHTAQSFRYLMLTLTAGGMHKGHWDKWEEHCEEERLFCLASELGMAKSKGVGTLFSGPPGQHWFFETENDSACLMAEGVDGTEHLEADKAA